jgi:hypothetical protein
MKKENTKTPLAPPIGTRRGCVWIGSIAEVMERSNWNVEIRKDLDVLGGASGESRISHSRGTLRNKPQRLQVGIGTCRQANRAANNPYQRALKLPRRHRRNAPEAW